MLEQNGISEDELEELGYVKLADDERVVKKVVLSEEEAEFMESHKHLSFYEFSDCVSIYVKSIVRKPFGKCVVERRLNNAYFNGYVIKEKKYYIKFVPGNDFSYLNIDKANGEWGLCEKEQTDDIQTQFTQSEVDELQKDEQASGFDLKALKVRVPDDELVNEVK